MLTQHGFTKLSGGPIAIASFHKWSTLGVLNRGPRGGIDDV